MRAFGLFLWACLACACSDKAPPTRADPTPSPWYKTPPFRPQILGVTSPDDARRLVEERGFAVVALRRPDEACADARWAWACADGVRLVAIDALEDAPAIAWIDAPEVERALSDRFGEAYARAPQVTGW